MRQVQQHREPGWSVRTGAIRGPSNSSSMIFLPSARGPHTVIDLGGAGAEPHDLRCDEACRGAAGTLTRHTQRPTRAQASDQLRFERAQRLDVERLVDCFV